MQHDVDLVAQHIKPPHPDIADYIDTGCDRDMFRELLEGVTGEERGSDEHVARLITEFSSFMASSTTSLLGDFFRSIIAVETSFFAFPGLRDARPKRG